MEPTNVNPTGADDALESLLRDSAPAIADHGFSTLVMTAVDADGRRARMRLVAIVIGGAAGAAVAAAAGAFGGQSAQLAEDLQRSFADVAALAANPAVMTAALLIAAALVHVFRRNEGDAATR